jgi:hypothetical protein
VGIAHLEMPEVYPPNRRYPNRDRQRAVPFFSPSPGGRSMVASDFNHWD